MRKSVETQITHRAVEAQVNSPTPFDSSTPSVDGSKMVGSPRLDLMKVRGDHIQPQRKDPSKGSGSPTK